MELTLDYKTWICGTPPSKPKLNNEHGYGNTCLLNNHGYMCCLGQFALQCGLKKNEIKGEIDPSYLDTPIVGLSLFDTDYDNEISNSKLSVECVSINDDKSTTIAEKVKRIKAVLSKYKRKLILRNFPKNILYELKQMRVKYVVKNSRKKNTQKVPAASSA